MSLIASALLTLAALNLDEDAQFLVSPSIEFPIHRPTREEAESRSYPFTSEQLRVLEQAVQVINAIPDSDKIRVVAHTDNIECTPQSGPPPAVIPDGRGLCPGLAQYRAGVVAWKLVELGADRSKFVEAALGDSYPIAPNDSEQNRARNRVVQFVDETRKGRGNVVELAPTKP